jgi:hypothetical protein
MTCVSPPELDDRELLTYMDGEAATDVVAHVERCPHCRERARRIARVQGRLTTQLYRIACPSTEDLGEYHLRVLPRDRAAAVARHLKECPHCTREVAQLRDYLGDLAPDLEFSSLERIRVLVAQLVRGGRESGGAGALAPAPAYAGLRGEEEGPRIYRADETQIAIEIQDDPEQRDHRILLGLLTGMDIHGLTAHLWQADQRIAGAAVDELGNFVIPSLAPGSYELILSGPEVEIHIQDLVVGTA